MSIVNELKQTISECYAKIKAIQEECSHPALCRTWKAKGNTGNYDPHEDSYWYDHHCTLCDKQWSTPQDHEHRPPAGSKELK